MWYAGVLPSRGPTDELGHTALVFLRLAYFAERNARQVRRAVAKGPAFCVLRLRSIPPWKLETSLVLQTNVAPINSVKK